MPAYKQNFQKGLVYLIVSKSKGWYKIGVTEQAPGRRLSELRERAPAVEIDLVASIPSDDCQRLEDAFHALFKPNRLATEKWGESDVPLEMRASLSTSEWFELDERQVEMFKAFAETTGVEQANDWVKRSAEYHFSIFKHNAETHASLLGRYFELLDIYKELAKKYRDEQAKSRTLKNVLSAAANYCKEYHTTTKPGGL